VRSDITLPHGWVLASFAATRPLGDTGTPSPLAENNVKDVDETATLPIYGIMGYNPYV